MNRCRWSLVVLALGIIGFATVAGACRIPEIRPWLPRPPWPHPEPPPVVRPVPALEPMLTRIHKADIELNNGVASVSVSAVFYNPNNARIEGAYFFPIEPDAVVRDFAMTVNGKEMKAELLEADKARETYEDIVRRMKDPALLEYVGTRMLKARVYPIEPNSEVRVTLKYTQVARFDGGVYHLRYPLRSAKPNAGSIDQVAVSVRIASEKPVKLFYSPSHKIDTIRKSDHDVSGGFEERKNVPDRDFDVYWSLDQSNIGVSVAAYKPKDEDGYCLIALTPQVEVDEREVQPKDVIFVFDKSGSMSGKKIEQAREALKYCLHRLRKEDRFAVVAFSTDMDLLTDGLVTAAPEAVEAAIKNVGRMEARGGTAIHAALRKALELVKRDAERLSMIVFLTDGRPTIGETDTPRILDAVQAANKPNVRLFVFGVGYDLNTDLLDRLAVDNGGTQQYVGEDEDIEFKVSNFYAKVSEPVLSDVVVEAQGVELRELYPRRVPDVFAGGQVLLFGRYRGTGRGTVVVRGSARNRKEAFECGADFGGSDRNDFLPSVWAHRKVAFLMEEIRLRGKHKEIEDEIVALGKRYGIVTPYTSFLIVEDEKPALREQVGFMRRSFEAAKSGRDAVAVSRNLAGAKMMDAAAPAGAPAMVGFGDREGAAGGGAGGFEPMRTAARRSMRKVADKVFYLARDGCFYDSLFVEDMRDRIEEIKRFSEAYFGLLDRHRDIGRYLADGANLVLCIDDKVYRIVE